MGPVAPHVIHHINELRRVVSRAKEVPEAMMSIMVPTFDVFDKSAKSLSSVGLGLFAIGLRRDPGKTMNETSCSS